MQHQRSTASAHCQQRFQRRVRPTTTTSTSSRPAQHLIKSSSIILLTPPSSALTFHHHSSQQQQLAQQPALTIAFQICIVSNRHCRSSSFWTFGRLQRSSSSDIGFIVNFWHQASGSPRVVGSGHLSTQQISSQHQSPAHLAQPTNNNNSPGVTATLDQVAPASASHGDAPPDRPDQSWTASAPQPIIYLFILHILSSSFIAHLVDIVIANQSSASAPTTTWPSITHHTS